MQKVFHFDTAVEPYVSDAAVVQCFDHRFGVATQKFIKRMGVKRPDVITIAGSIRALTSSTEEYERAFVLDQLRTSIAIHQTRRVLLFSHSDCGRYGGLAAFGHDRQAEKAFHQTELEQAAKVIRQEFPDLEVSCYHAAEDGVWEVK